MLFHLETRHIMEAENALTAALLLWLGMTLTLTATGTYNK